MRTGRRWSGALLGAAAALASGCDVGRAISWLEGDPGTVAQALAADLRGAPGVGEVSASGMQVKLLGGTLRLRVRDAGKRGDRPGAAHIHVVARIAGEEAALDACIYANADTRQAALKQAAELYLERAFPPVLALVREDSSTDALRFGGTERWAVPGVRGHLGPWSWWGRPVDEDALILALQRARPFEGIAGLPVDGRPHLIKLVLAADGDAWSRAIEIDGAPVDLPEERWSGAPVEEDVTLVRFAAYRKADALEDLAARERATRQLAAREQWLFGGPRCPAERLPATLHSPPWAVESCRGGRLLDCLEECRGGSGPSCYAGAHEAEDADLDEAALALYLRACEHGVASGCTNAAATLRNDPAHAKSELARGDCPERTFERVCAMSVDPWACVMIGDAWARGEGAPRDPARAREALGKACAEEDDPACEAARRILKELDRPAGKKR